MIKYKLYMKSDKTICTEWYVCEMKKGDHLTVDHLGNIHRDGNFIPGSMEYILNNYSEFIRVKNKQTRKKK